MKSAMKFRKGKVLILLFIIVAQPLVGYTRAAAIPGDLCPPSPSLSTSAISDVPEEASPCSKLAVYMREFCEKVVEQLLQGLVVEEEDQTPQRPRGPRDRVSLRTF